MRQGLGETGDAERKAEGRAVRAGAACAGDGRRVRGGAHDRRRCDRCAADVVGGLGYRAAAVGLGDRAALALLAADLKLTKTAPETVKLGEAIPYVITVTNDGDEAATNVLVTDTLPDRRHVRLARRPGQGLQPGRHSWSSARSRPSRPAEARRRGRSRTTAVDAGRSTTPPRCRAMTPRPLRATATTTVTASRRRPGTAALSIVKSAPTTAASGQLRLHPHRRQHRRRRAEQRAGPRRAARRASRLPRSAARTRLRRRAGVVTCALGNLGADAHRSRCRSM